MPYMQAPIYAMPQQPQVGWPPQSQPQSQPQARLMVPQSPAVQPQAPLAVPPPPAFTSNDLKPKVRAVSQESAPPTPPARPRIVLPTPESLGIQVATTTPRAAVDWNQIHARLDQLGIVNFQRDRLPEGGFRIVLALPKQQVEGTGATEAAAMVAALQRAETLVSAGR
jgi:hypothetical protein